MLFAENEFELNSAEGGATIREHLTSIWNQTGVKPEALEPLPFPELLTDVWGYFLELHNARTSNGFGINPISFTEIDAWARLTNKPVSPGDINIIRQLDNIFLKHNAKEQDKKAK